MSGEKAEIKVGNCLPLANIPVGTQVHNIELYPGRGGQLVRSAGNSAQLMAKEGKYATLRLPSGEMRMVHLTRRATISLAILIASRLQLVKQDANVIWDFVPQFVLAMNPNDHPHGG